jgi:hypothetical protein
MNRLLAKAMIYIGHGVEYPAILSRTGIRIVFHLGSRSQKQTKKEERKIKCNNLFYLF